MMSELVCLYIFSALMLIALGFSIRTKGFLSISSFVLMFYTFSSLCAIAYFNNPLYGLLSESTDIALDGTLYLFVTLMIFFIPLFLFPSELKRVTVDGKRFRVVYYTIFAITVLTFVFNVMEHKFTLHNFAEDFVDVRNDSYSESEEKTSKLAGFVAGYLGAFNYFSIPVAMLALFVFRYKRWLSAIFFGIALVSPIYNSLVVAGRSEIVNMMFVLGYSFLLCQNLISRRVYKGFISFMCFLGVVVFAYILFANFMRFEDQTAGASFFLWKYTGESIVNFTGTLYPSIRGYTYGVSSFGFFRRLIGLDYSSDLMGLRTFVERRTGTPGYIFYTFIGNFFRDFGAAITMFMGMAYAKIMGNTLSVSVNKLNSGSASMRCGTWLLFAFLGNMYLPGLFYFSLYSQVGNIGIILAIFLYFYLNHDTETIDE